MRIKDGDLVEEDEIRSKVHNRPFITARSRDKVVTIKDVYGNLDYFLKENHDLS